MKKNTPLQYARALYEVTKDLVGDNLSQVIKDFVLILVKHRQISKAGQIIREFVRYSKKQAGFIELEVTAARKVPLEILSRIKKIFGEKVEIKETLNHGLIGGLIIKTEDKIFDVSLKKQLMKLKEKLI